MKPERRTYRVIPIAAGLAVAASLTAPARAQELAAPPPTVAAGAPAQGPSAATAAPVAPAAPAPAPVVAAAPAPVVAPAQAPVVAAAPAPATPPTSAPTPSRSTDAVAQPDASAPRTVMVTSPGEALVHVAVDHRDAWLELRSYVDGGAFVRACAAPCDVRLRVEGREARVVAPGMTPSNVFRFDSGSGTAGVRVEGGAASARRAGIISLAIGIPVALLGMGLYAQGRVKDSKGLQVGGIAGLAAGGLSVGFALPLLMLGSTHVKDAKGALIAFSPPSANEL